MKWLDVALFEIRLPPPWRSWDEVLKEAEKRYPGWSFEPPPAAHPWFLSGKSDVALEALRACPLPVVHEGGATTYTLLGRRTL